MQTNKYEQQNDTNQKYKSYYHYQVLMHRQSKTLYRNWYSE